MTTVKLFWDNCADNDILEVYNFRAALANAKVAVAEWEGVCYATITDIQHDLFVTIKMSNRNAQTKYNEVTTVEYYDNRNIMYALGSRPNRVEFEDSNDAYAHAIFDLMIPETHHVKVYDPVVGSYNILEVTMTPYIYSITSNQEEKL